MPLDQQTFDLKLRAPIATRMREIFGKDGEGWCKDAMARDRQRCLVGAWREARELAGVAWPKDELTLFNKILLPAFFNYAQHAHDPEEWNDAPERTYADIRRVVDEIERMEIAVELG